MYQKLFILAVLFSPIIVFAQFGEAQVITQSEVPNPNYVYPADIDGDGDLDLLVTPKFGNKILYFPNLDGSGNFGPPIIVDEVSLQLEEVLPVDIDGDGDLDLLAAGVNDNRPLVWYKNENGKGQFSEMKTISNNLDTPTSVFAGDVDNDGDIDILSSSLLDNKVAWYRNEDGLGNFSEQLVISSAVNYAEDVHAADLDGDGDLDVIAASGMDGKIIWYEFNHLIGAYTNSSTIYNDLLSWPSFLTTEDIDKDGDLDILANSETDDALMWFENENGKGSFSPANIISEDIAWPRGFKMVDIDNDNDKDLMYSGQDEIGWFENKKGDFKNKTTIDLGQNFRKSINYGDIDNDGDLDLLAGLAHVDEVIWYENKNGKGRFSEKKVISQEGFSNADYVTGADINNDGLNDLVAFASTVTTGSIIWYQNIGGRGNFAPYKTISDTISSPYALITTDIDKDNFIDIVIAARSGLMWLKNLGGLGEFRLMPLIAERPGTPLFVIDLDGDGDMDIISTDKSRDIIYAYSNDGSGNFSSPMLISEEHDNVYNIFLADLDGDDDKDLLGGSVKNKEIFWHENIDGRFSFGPPQIIANNINFPRNITANDLDGDQDMDIILYNTNSNELIWFENTNGQGDFGDVNILSDQLNNGGELTIFDFDFDNDNDIFAMSSQGQKLVLFENVDNQGIFNEILISTDFKYITSINQTDIDGDGDMDLLYTDSSADKIAWFPNFAELQRVTAVCFWDKNQNGIQDPLEISLKDQKISLTPEANTSWYGINGELYYNVAPNNYSMVYEANPLWQVTSPSSINLEISSIGTPIVEQFGLTPTNEQFAIQAALTSAPVRCGFTVPFWLDITNTGNQTIEQSTASIELPERVTLIDAIPYPTKIEGQLLTWEISDLEPSYSEQMKLYLEIPGIERLGEELSFLTNATIIANNDTLDVHNYLSNSVITCAFDPNDKQIIPDPPGEENCILFEDTISYRIRFQNTGTDTAFNVIIEDQLDTNLDWATFHNIRTSHPCEVSLDKFGLAKFKFANILLPDSTTNEPESHGYIKFDIKAKTVPENTIIKNQASIFFDFNAPIITNETIATMVSEIPISKYISEGQPSIVKVFPNPCSNYCKFQINSSINYADYEIIIFDIMGKRIGSVAYESDNTIHLNRTGLPSGLYFYVLSEKNKNSIIESGKFMTQ